MSPAIYITTEYVLRLIPSYKIHKYLTGVEFISLLFPTYIEIMWAHYIRQKLLGRTYIFIRDVFRQIFPAFEKAGKISKSKEIPN